MTAALRAGGGQVDERVDRALAVLLDELGMQVAYVSVFQDDERVVTYSRSVPDGPELPPGTAHPLTETICHLTAGGVLEPLVADASQHHLLKDHPHTIAYGLGGYASVPLVIDGHVAGAVCAASTVPAPDLSARDETTLRAVAAHLAEVFGEAARVLDTTAAAGAPAAADDGLECLTRPLLQLVQRMTGLDAIYLTLFDSAGDELVLAYAEDVAGFGLPIGTSLPWRETPCRLVIDAGLAVVTDLPDRWPDLPLVALAGCRTWMSTAIRDREARLIGTLCGAGRAEVAVSEAALVVVRGVAEAVAGQLSREAAQAAQAVHNSYLQQRLDALHDRVERDDLTRLRNRSGINRWLRTGLAGLGDSRSTLMLAFIDLDGFKTVNDTRGHAAGDEVLCLLADRLRATGRGGDLRGRLGGDEFVCAAVLPADADEQAWALRIRQAAQVTYGDIACAASIGIIAVTDPATRIEDILAQADAAMYRDKAIRQRVLATR